MIFSPKFRRNLKSLHYVFRGCLAPLRIMQKSFSDGQGRPFFFEKFKLSFSRIFGTSYNHLKNILRWSGGGTVFRSVNYFFVQFWHLLESCKNNFPMVRGDLFFEKFKLFLFADCWPPWKTWKSIPDGPPWKPFPLGPCPDDRAQNSVQDSLNESSVRPNPTLVFSKIRSQILTPQYRPKPPQKSTPPRAWGVYRPQKRKILIGPVCIRFFANRIYWIYFCSGRYQPEKRKILIGPVCIRFFRKQDLLEFSFFPASTSRKKGRS